ncbi:MAG: hypothetical protein FJY85_05430, partial [Deltaproteobacteria bacterium]|nr:hypothetical protein [Deltaproteobacteria bacterium]
MNREPHDGQGPADAILPSLSSALKVLIVGDSHALTRCGEVLNALMLAGYGFKIVGWMDTSGLDFDTADALVSERLSTRLRNGLSRVGDPDLVLLACEDPYLRRQIHDLVPLAASVLDPAALDVIARLSRATHASPPGLSDSTHIESVKEVLMSGPEMSIMVLDEDLRVLEITNYLLNKAGKPRDDCLSMPCYRILWGHDQPCDLKGDTCIAREVIGTGRSAHSLRKEIARDGSVRFFTTSGYPMKPLQDGKKRVLVVWKDVTRGVAPVLNRQADDLRENFSRLLRHDKMVALGKLASAAVHEINNPLQGILTFAKLIRQSLDKNLVSDADLERFRTYLDLIVSECSR